MNTDAKRPRRAWAGPARSVLVALLAASACYSSQYGRDVTPAGRPLWNQCSSAVSRWCHAQGGGDPYDDRACEGNTESAYAALTTDAARRQFMSTHGCALPPVPTG